MRSAPTLRKRITRLSRLTRSCMRQAWLTPFVCDGIRLAISSLAKRIAMEQDGAATSRARAMVAWARDEILKLLHPFMPINHRRVVGGGQARSAKSIAVLRSGRRNERDYAGTMAAISTTSRTMR